MQVSKPIAGCFHRCVTINPKKMNNCSSQRGTKSCYQPGSFSCWSWSGWVNRSQPWKIDQNRSYSKCINPRMITAGTDRTWPAITQTLVHQCPRTSRVGMSIFTARGCPHYSIEMFQSATHQPLLLQQPCSILQPWCIRQPQGTDIWENLQKKHKKKHGFWMLWTCHVSTWCSPVLHHVCWWFISPYPSW